jgi:hypothetical protein
VPTQWSASYIDCVLCVQEIEQRTLQREYDIMRLEKEQHQQARIQVEKKNESLEQEKAQLEARLRHLEALQRRLTHHTATPSGNESKSTSRSVSLLPPEDSDKSISKLIDAVKDLERHVVIVCQRSQQQDASGGSFEKTVSYLQQLDKKIHAGKVSKTKMVTDTISHLMGRVQWAQVRSSTQHMMSLSPFGELARTHN